MTNTSFLLFSALAMLASSCYGPYDYVHPEFVPAAAVAVAIDNTATDHPMMAKDIAIPTDWWLVFDDEQLTGFIHKALSRNPTLHIAQSKIFAAFYEAQKLCSVLLPNVTLTGDIQRVKLSKTGVFPAEVPATLPVASGVPNAPVVPSLIPFYFTLYESALNFKYDLDLWCKNRNAVAAALDEMEASLADEAFTRLTLSIAVAEAYFQLQIDYERLAIAKEIVANRGQYEDYIGQRLKHNVETDFTRNLAHLNLTSSLQVLTQIEGLTAVHEHQLRALLADNFDEEIAPINIKRKQLPRIPIPEALPLHLLSMRPDIMSQLWIIESGCRQVAIAKAGFYPDVNLMGFFGYQTIHPKRFFEWASGFGVAEAAFSLPIFDGGFLVANLKSKQVNYDLAILKYNQLILDAVKEVLDGISLLDSNYKQFVLFEKETADQQANDALTRLRQQHHIASGIDRLNSQQLYLAARDQQMIALGNTLNASLQLIKALGGGYEACITNEVK